MDHGTTRRKTIKGMGAVVIGTTLAGCGGDGGDSDGTTTVDMTDDLIYDPDSITVSVGETVVWENVGSIGHSVTAYEDELPDGAAYFASGGLDSEQAARDGFSAGDSDSGAVLGDETYEHTFEIAGTHEYFCIPHESAGMVGTVEVQ